MNDSSAPLGLDLPFRQTGLDLIKARLKEKAQKYNNDPTVHRALDEIAKRFEHKVFVKATSRDDYINIIKKRLADITTMLPASPITGNPLERNVIPRPIVQSSSAQHNFNQNPNMVSSQYQPSRMQIPAMQQPSYMPAQNHQSGQQNHDFRQHIQQPQYTAPLINPQGPLTQYPDSRLQGDQRSSPNVPSQNFSAASALSSISDSGTTKLDHVQLLIDKFRRAKFAYLPELHKWLKTMEGHLSQVQSVGERETLQRHIVSVRQMIRLLNITENQLMQFDKQKLRYIMNIVFEYYNKVVKNGSISFAMNQAHQLSSLLKMVSTNITQNTLTNPVHMNQPPISSSTINPRISSGLIRFTEQMDMKNNTITNLVTQGSTNHHSHLNMRKDPQIQSPQTPQSVRQPEKRKHPIDSASVRNVGKSSANETVRKSKKPCSKPREKSSGISLESWLNLATPRSKRPSIPTKLSQSSTPSTPMTPSGNNGEIEIAKEASNPQEHLILEELVPTVGALEDLSGSPMLSDSTGLEPNQQHPEKQPIDRLLDAVKLASKETLGSAVNDMNSAIIEMDLLPDIAYLDRSDVPTIDVDLAEFVESMHYDCMNDEDEQPFKRLKRDIESVSRDASFPPSNNSAVQQSSNLEPKKNHPVVMRPYQKFLDEIKDANQNLSGTVIEIVEESSNEGNGTIVRCTYSRGAGSADNLRSTLTSRSMNLSVEFLVPFEYPTSPPKILDSKLPDFGIVKEMTEMAKSMFDSQVGFTYSLRVGEMARVWDGCAQSVFLAYEKLFGAEILSSESGGVDPAGPDS